jgi:O-antigen ligase
MFVKPPKPFLFQLLFLGVLVTCQGRAAIAATLVILAVGVVAGRNRGAWTLRRTGAIAGLTVVLTAVVFSVGEIRGAAVGQGNIGQGNVGQGGDGTSVAERTVEELASINGRTPVWGFTMDLMGDRMLLGVGPDGARPLFLERFGWATSPHNGYLDVFLAAGWIGGVCFLVGWAAAAVKALRSSALDKRVGLLLVHAYLGALAVLGGLVSPSTTAGIFLLGVMAQVCTGGHEDVGA